MWTVLKKELREGWLFLLVNVAWLLGVPPVMGLLFPSKWDADVTSIFYAIMFGVFVPLYLVILAAGLVQDENTFLIRGLPVRPWKVAGGKLLYLVLNFVVLEGLTVPYMMGPVALPDWLESDLVYIFLWMAATAVAALAAFAFAAFLPRKSYAFFASLLATVLGMGSLMYLTSVYTPAVAADRMIHIILGASFLLLFAGAIIAYHDLVRQARLRWARVAAVTLLLPAIAGVLWLRAPLWLKQVMVGNPYNLEPAGINLFIASSRWGSSQEPYLFDASTGTLRSFPFLGDAEFVAGTDPQRNRIYTATRKTIPREKMGYRKFSAMDLITGKATELGLLPAHWVGFDGDIARWVHTENKNRMFGFKDLVRGTTFDFDASGCRFTTWGPEGVLYDLAGPEGTAWMFVDFATAQPREVFRGNYYPWPWSEAGGYFFFEGTRDYSKGLPWNQELFCWDPVGGALKKVGSGRPLLVRENHVVLIRGEEDGPKTLVLYKDGAEVATLATDFVGGYPLGYMRADTWVHVTFPWKLLFWSDMERNSKSLGLLTIEGGKLILKTRALPPLTREIMPVPGSGEVLLYLREKDVTVDWNEMSLVYRMDPATGKMRRLV